MKTKKSKKKTKKTKISDGPKFITASMPVTFSVADVAADLAYDKDSDDVTLEDVKEYIQESYLEILSINTSPAALTDEYGQSV